MSDNINKPAHYTFSGIEVIDAIEAWELGFHLGNVIKYIARAGRKDVLETLNDLKKARWYLDREISRREADRLKQAKAQVGEILARLGGGK